METIYEFAASYITDKMITFNAQLKEELSEVIKMNVESSGSLSLDHSSRYTDLITKHLMQLYGIEACKPFSIIVTKENVLENGNVIYSTIQSKKGM